ncbi:hypothetical protein ACH5RR_038805 [Cinchona calisaya]|uniref:Fe2OG dioxygenase domain-containing protein n=1 Tax=Cinchona calisaya TaxID=153742 RepID=A0ABD2Y1L8_9GENT
MNSTNDFDVLQVPIIDLSLLQRDSQERPLVIKQIHQACRTVGIFAIINHGISETIIEEALNVNKNFFDLPLKTKEELMSHDMYNPVKYGVYQDQDGDQGILRSYLKLYSHPFEKFGPLWPANPPDYREKMGKCAMDMRKLSIQICGAIMESLNLEATYLEEKIERGVQMVAINSYSPISRSNKNLIGTAQHSDFSIITILLQSSSGLQVMETTEKTWKSIPLIKGSFLVLVGDLLEVLSNGEYNAVLHRVIRTSGDETRLSVAGFQSLEMDEILEPAIKLVDEEHPKKYKGCCLRDYLGYRDSGESKPFLETVKITSAIIKE